MCDHNGRHPIFCILPPHILRRIAQSGNSQERAQAMNTLAQRISQLDRQLAHYELESDTILSAMAGIYVDVISPLGPRIQVTGSPAVLQNALLQSKFAPRCWPVFVPPYSGSRSAEADCS